MKIVRSEQRSEASRFSVVVLDLSHYMDEGAETTVHGFETFELAREYARRRSRDSLEEQRGASTGPEDLRDRWNSFGENCLVIGGSYVARDELDYFIVHPATAEERDWVTLTPDPDMRRALQSVRCRPPEG